MVATDSRTPFTIWPDSGDWVTELSLPYAGKHLLAGSAPGRTLRTDGSPVGVPVFDRSGWVCVRLTRSPGRHYRGPASWGREPHGLAALARAGDGYSVVLRNGE